jgi:pteridine reductase
MDLKGKTALVTGAAKRVGRATALALAKQGAHLILHFNASKDEAEKTAAAVKALGVQCRLVQTDLEKPEEILQMIREVESGEPVRILVNNASIFTKTYIGTVTEAEWDHLMDVNLKAPFLLSKELGVRMANGEGGTIINIADWSGFRPYKNYLPYCTSKGGLITMTKALARDLAPKVRANAVAPGPVMLPADMPAEEKEKAIDKTLLRREGSPEDVAHAVVFLAENDYLNGLILPVDGGRSIN